MKAIVTAAVLALVATTATPSFAATRHHANPARQYESLVQRDARTVDVQPVRQPRTFSVWGSNFTID